MQPPPSACRPPCLRSWARPAAPPRPSRTAFGSSSRRAGWTHVAVSGKWLMANFYGGCFPSLSKLLCWRVQACAGMPQRCFWQTLLTVVAYATVPWAAGPDRLPGVPGAARHGQARHCAAHHDVRSTLAQPHFPGACMGPPNSSMRARTSTMAACACTTLNYLLCLALCWQALNA